MLAFPKHRVQTYPQIIGYWMGSKRNCLFWHILASGSDIMFTYSHVVWHWQLVGEHICESVTFVFVISWMVVDGCWPYCASDLFYWLLRLFVFFFYDLCRCLWFTKAWLLSRCVAALLNFEQLLSGSLWLIHTSSSHAKPKGSQPQEISMMISTISTGNRRLRWPGMAQLHQQRSGHGDGTTMGVPNSGMLTGKSHRSIHGW